MRGFLLPEGRASAPSTRAAGAFASKAAAGALAQAAGDDIAAVCTITVGLKAPITEAMLVVESFFEAAATEKSHRKTSTVSRPPSGSTGGGSVR